MAELEVRIGQLNLEKQEYKEVKKEHDKQINLLNSDLATHLKDIHLLRTEMANKDEIIESL